MSKSTRDYMRERAQHLVDWHADFEYLSDWEQEFVASLEDRLEKERWTPSDRQMEIIERILDERG